MFVWSSHMCGVMMRSANCGVDRFACAGVNGMPVECSPNVGVAAMLVGVGAVVDVAVFVTLKLNRLDDRRVALEPLPVVLEVRESRPTVTGVER